MKALDFNKHARSSLPIESDSQSVPGIDTVHAQVHAGNAFAAGATFTINASAVDTLAITVPTGTEMHLCGLEISSNGPDILVEFLKDPSVSAGTTLASCNRKTKDVGKKGVNILRIGAPLTDGDTITVGSRTYTYKTNLSVGPAVPNEILIGANEAASVTNTVKAITDAGTAGTHYGLGTVEHADVTAVDGTGNTVVFVTKTRTATAYATTAVFTDAANNTWGTATVTGGADTDSDTNATVTLKTTVTRSGYDGELMTLSYMGGGTGVGVTKSGGVTGERTEWELYPGTYLLRITNNGSAAAKIGIAMTWYEVAD